MTITYYASFIDEHEERLLVDAVYAAPEPFKALRARRTMALGGTPDDVASFGRVPLPEWWTTLPFVARIDALCLFDGHQANHVLLNEYEPGGGILPHTDGPRYFPRVAILSCLSACRMKWRERAADGGGVVCTRWLERRSLVVFDGAEYTDLLHGIDAVKVDSPRDDNDHLESVRDERLSCTIRFVPPPPQ